MYNMDNIVTNIGFHIEKMRQIDTSINKEIYQIDDSLVFYSSNMYKYYLIWQPGEGKTNETRVRNITEYEPASSSIYRTYPLFFYLKEKLHRSRVLIRNHLACKYLECLLLLSKLQKISYKITIYNGMIPRLVGNSKFIDSTNKLLDKIKKIYPASNYKFIKDYDNTLYFDDKNIDTDDKFDLIDIRIQLYDNSMDDVVKLIKVSLKRLELNGMLIIEFDYRSIVYEYLVNIICSLSQIFDNISYYKDIVNVISFCLIFTGYSGSEIDINTDDKYMLTTSTDLEFIHTDIIDFSHRVEKNQSNMKKNGINSDVAAKINDIAFLNSNIDIFNVLQIPVKQSILKLHDGIEQIQKKYIKHKSKANNFTINNLNIKLTKPNGKFVFTNKTIDKYKKELNNYQFFIDTRDVKKWKSVTQKTNLPLYIKTYVRDKYNMPNVSRAFVKMYEILSSFNLINNKCNALHICEAPGEFIEATYHYTHSNNIEYKWNANSLNYRSPLARLKYGYILGDFFSLIKKYPNNWLFGEDDTGDITNVSNIEHITKKAKENLGDINLITSDCGLDPSGDPEEHETTMSQVNLAQVILCLKTLTIHGNAVFKTYVPFSRPITRSILLLLANSFEKITLTKQIAGSPGSSEIYVVCQNYLKMETDFTYLFERLTKFNPTLDLYINYPPQFLDFIEIAVESYIKKQVSIIKRNFYYYENKEILEKHLPEMEKYKKKLAIEWCRMVKFKKITEHL